MKPLLEKSALLTTGTAHHRRPARGWTPRGGRNCRASPERVLQRKTLSTSSAAGPVDHELVADDPVRGRRHPQCQRGQGRRRSCRGDRADGPALQPAIVGARCARDWSWSQPSPSRTSSTTWSARRNKPGSQSGRCSGGGEQRRCQRVQAGATVGREQQRHGQDERARTAPVLHRRGVWPGHRVVRSGRHLARHFRHAN